jgi:hypothetical protein
MSTDITMLDRLNLVPFVCVPLMFSSNLEIVVFIRIALDIRRVAVTFIGIVLFPGIALGQLVVGDVQHPPRIAG